MERNSRDVERLLQIIIIQIIVCAMLAHVRTHADRVEHEVDFTAEQFHRILEYLFQILNACCVCRYNRSVKLLGKSVQLTHTQRHRSIAQGYCSPLLNSLHGHFPCDGFLVERAEDDTALTF